MCSRTDNYHRLYRATMLILCTGKHSGGGTLCPLSLSVVDEEKKGNQARAESHIDSVRKIDSRQAEGEKEGTETKIELESLKKSWRSVFDCKI